MGMFQISYGPEIFSDNYSCEMKSFETPASVMNNLERRLEIAYFPVYDQWADLPMDHWTDVPMDGQTCMRKCAFASKNHHHLNTN